MIFPTKKIILTMRFGVIEICDDFYISPSSRRGEAMNEIEEKI